MTAKRAKAQKPKREKVRGAVFDLELHSEYMNLVRVIRDGEWMDTLCLSELRRCGLRGKLPARVRITVERIPEDE